MKTGSGLAGLGASGVGQPYRWTYQSVRRHDDTLSPE
jgi:hypothetical protein